MKQVQYGDQSYQIGSLPTSKAIKLLSKITKVSGPAIAKLVSAKSNNNFDDILPEAIQLLIDRIEEDNVLDIVKGLISAVTKDAKVIMFESEFQGNLGLLLNLCKDSMVVNYAGFIEELQNLDL